MGDIIMSFKAYVQNFYDMRDMAPVQHVAHIPDRLQMRQRWAMIRQEQSGHISIFQPVRLHMAELH